jgi:hypothetical protein
MSDINSPIEALEEALRLAITAPTDEDSDKASELAGQIVAGFGISEHEVAQAKKKIEKEVKEGKL